jgi:hypothetical protein
MQALIDAHGALALGVSENEGAALPSGCALLCRWQGLANISQVFQHTLFVHGFAAHEH